MELSVEKPKSIEKLYDENSGLWKFVRIDKGQTKSVEVIEKTFCRLGLSKKRSEGFHVPCEDRRA